MSKYDYLKDNFINLYKEHESIRKVCDLLSEEGTEVSWGGLRQQGKAWVAEFLTENTSETNQKGTAYDESLLDEELIRRGIPKERVKSVKHWTTMSGQDRFSIVEKTDNLDLDKFFNDILNQIKDYSPKYPTIIRKKQKDSHLMVLSPADIHLGKLASSFECGESYNNQIAVQRVLEGTHGLIQKADGFPIDKVNLIIGNDILHIDTPNRKTTSGTPQDTDGMWFDNFVMAKKLYVDVIEILMQLSNVHVTYNPSNHDYQSGFFLAQNIQDWFRHSKHITFDCSIAHRKYFKYHNNLIGSTHGDGAKQDLLPLLMANESPDWSTTPHRYIYGHHVHHKISKDYPGVTYETLRSPSGTDSWHHRNGYEHCPKAIEGFIHHREHGQIARLTHLF